MEEAFKERLVAQVSKPAVSPISKSAEREIFEAYRIFQIRRFKNLRYSRLGSLRYHHINLIQAIHELKSCPTLDSQ
jgi:hypothetical protein